MGKSQWSSCWEGARDNPLPISEKVFGGCRYRRKQNRQPKFQKFPQGREFSGGESGNVSGSAALAIASHPCHMGFGQDLGLGVGMGRACASLS